MNFQRERAHDLWAEVMPLFQAHWQEIAHYQDIPLDPDQALYNLLEEHDGLRWYTARRETQLVGYSVYRIGPSPHYRGSKQASQDVLFVLPELRKGWSAYRLIRFCDEQLRGEGVQVVYHHVKKAHDFGRLLEHMDYELVDLIYAKRLDKE